MITNEKIDELLRQKAKIWGIGRQGNVFCVGLKFRPETLKNKKWLENKYEVYSKFFETEEEAKWFAEFGCIKRTQRLELPTWEEVSIDLKDVHAGNYIIKEFDDVSLEYIKYRNGNYAVIGVYKYDDRLELEATKENYIKACRKCKEIFLGEKK